MPINNFMVDICETIQTIVRCDAFLKFFLTDYEFNLKKLRTNYGNIRIFLNFAHSCLCLDFCYIYNTQNIKCFCPDKMKNLQRCTLICFLSIHLQIMISECEHVLYIQCPYSSLEC